MGVFEVYFFGLICHVSDSDDTKSHAVIVDAAQHVPLIVVDDTPHRLRKGDNVRFSLPSGDVNTTPDFKKYVPGLQELIVGIDDIREEIASGTTDSDTVGYVYYPIGDLGVADLFSTSASYQIGEAEVRPDGCIARLTYVQVTTDKRVDVRYGNSVENVSANSWVLVSNSSPPNTSDHFFEYLRLTKGSDIGAPRDGNQECDLSDTPRYVEDVKRFLGIQNAKSFDKASVARAAARLERMRSKKVSGAETRQGDIETEATDVECTNSKWP
jgi:hypothetical protein